MIWLSLGSRCLKPRTFRTILGAVALVAGCSDLGLLPRMPSHAHLVHKIAEPYPIEITGNEKRWFVRYPGPDGVLFTGDDVHDRRNVHVPSATSVTLILKSRDFVYTLSLPRSEQKQIAVPTLEFSLDCFEQTAGRFPLIGDQLCGDEHPELVGELIVEPRDRFCRWIDDHAS
jgi:heme/copper-type cytochrome/quinol oxidase subunit 2